MPLLAQKTPILTDPPHPALGLACAQEAELHRLRGELDVAADAYGRPNRSGFPPMPGLALLNLVPGEVAAATAGIRRALGEAGQPFQRPSLLAAAAEIFVAADDVAAADEAAGELASIAARSSSQVLGAMAEQARGSVLLAAGEAGAALAPLRAASGVWQRLRISTRRPVRPRHLLRPAPPAVAIPVRGLRPKFCNQLRSIAEGPVEIEVVRTLPTSSGFVTEQVETQHTPDGDMVSRRLHVCEVRSGQICAVTTTATAAGTMSCAPGTPPRRR
jgi:hypothetical protein